MARIIAEAGVRLVVDRKGLGVGIRRAIRDAVQDAARGGGLFDDVDRDSQRTARRVQSTWSRVLGGVTRAFATMLSGAASIGKLLLIGTAAGAALAGVASLTTGVLALSQALVAASGAALLLPAALAGLKAVTATVKIGLVGMDDAMKALNKDAAAFEETIKDLAPEAQKFMRSLRALQPAFRDLRMDVQNRLFLGLSARLEELTRQYLPLANRLFVTMAGTINETAHELAGFLSQTSTVTQAQGIVDNLRLAFAKLAPSIVPATQALLDVASVGSTFLPRLADQVNQAAVRFAEFVRRAAETGQLEAIIQRAIEVISQLGRIARNVFSTISNVMDSANASGLGLLDNIEKITSGMADFTGSFAGQAMISGFFAQLKRVIDAVWPAVRTLVEVFIRDFVPILADIAEIIGPVLRPLLEGFGRLLQSLRPLIEALADAFATVLEALEPVFDAIAKAVEESMPILEPIIQDIADAFVRLIEALVPLIPVFFDLLEAILPIIPPLLDMAAELMPEIIELIEALIPVIEAWIDMMVVIIPIFTDIVNFLLNIFVPAVEAIAAVFTGIYDVISFVVEGIWTVITTVFGAIRDFVVGLWNGISSFFSGIWKKIGGVFSGSISDIAGRIGRWASDMIQKAKDMMGRFVDAIGRGIGNVVQWFKELPGRVFGAIGDFIGRMVQFGKDLVQGIVNGIISAARKVIDSVRNMVNDALATARAALGIASPSREFFKIGQFIGQGLVNGLNQITPKVADAAANMVSFATDALSGPLNGASLSLATTGGPLGAGAGIAGGTVVNQTNIMREGSDVKQFSDLVLGRTMGDYWSGASTLTVARNGVQAGVNDQWVGA